MANLLARLLVINLAVTVTAFAADSASWHDPSKHTVQFVTVEKGLRLEVLDWGGSGRPVVLLAGSGNTAHIFDDFAERLSGACCHVYGITRRGFGASTHPDSGYDQQRLAHDVLQVLDALKLVAPVVAGHSMSGEELTTLGDEHSDRLAGLVYLDATADPTDYPGDSAAYTALFDKLPAAMRANGSEPDASDLRSFKAFHDFKVRQNGYEYPEAELRASSNQNPDGSVGSDNAPDKVHFAIGRGALPRDYSRIRVPILALFGTLSINYRYQAKDAQERAAIEEFDAATQVYADRNKTNLLKAKGGVRMVDLPHADHYLFLSNEADVLREMRAFIAGLK
ncbi:MAG TPA: alpha/beta hydrolase [Candidatus Sulfotelmatobacter sp.]|nr:alpha/beta hydrolase [Candidatus Sulfotelmatobacter sp.]